MASRLQSNIANPSTPNRAAHQPQQAVPLSPLTPTRDEGPAQEAIADPKAIVLLHQEWSTRVLYAMHDMGCYPTEESYVYTFLNHLLEPWSYTIEGIYLTVSPQRRITLPRREGQAPSFPQLIPDFTVTRRYDGKTVLHVEGKPIQWSGEALFDANTAAHVRRAYLRAVRQATRTSLAQACAQALSRFAQEPDTPSVLTILASHCRWSLILFNRPAEKSNKPPSSASTIQFLVPKPVRIPAREYDAAIKKLKSSLASRIASTLQPEVLYYCERYTEMISPTCPDVRPTQRLCKALQLIAYATAGGNVAELTVFGSQASWFSLTSEEDARPDPDLLKQGKLDFAEEHENILDEIRDPLQALVEPAEWHAALNEEEDDTSYEPDGPVVSNIYQRVFTRQQARFTTPKKRIRAQPHRPIRIAIGQRLSQPPPSPTSPTPRRGPEVPAPLI